MTTLRRILLGRRLASDETQDTRVNQAVGLSMFSSDALSSVAYATQEIMASLSGSLHHLGFAALTAAGTAHALYGLSVPVALGIVLLLVILGSSYRQTIRAYPSGGGAYLVAQENLGEIPALVAGASLLVDYVLTVAVSASAGVANLSSAFPGLRGQEVPLTLGVIALVALVNLRGGRTSRVLLTLPTYGFLAMMGVLLVLGLSRAWGSQPTPEMVQTSVETATQVSRLGLVLVFLKAFSAGCTALTGVESISHGVQSFREPSAHNARHAMVWMVLILACLFLGITYLASHFHVVYAHSADPTVVSETLLSRLAKAIYGDVAQGLPRLLYVGTQGFTFLILVVAANTAYAGFPRLAALMGRDRYLPKQLASQGDRLVFSNGIIILTLMSGLLAWLLHANTDLLLPLYALGVFTGFTLSQAGMVLHWWKVRERDRHWRPKAVVNGLGALATGVVWADIVLTKFKMEGGFGGVWILLVLIPLMVWLFLHIHRHYIRVRSLLAASRTEEVYARRNRVLVLVSRIHRGTLEALHYARSIGEPGQVEALCVDFTDAKGFRSAERERLETDWWHYSAGVPLRFLDSPYRKVMEPILAEVDRMRGVEPELTLTIVLPEFVTEHWWGNILHNQTAFLLKTALLSRPHTVVISIPYQLER